MSQVTAPISHTGRFYIGGQWVAPSSDATISVIDSDTEQVYFTVPEAQAADISRAVGAAREAFDSGPWPWLSHEQRAEYLRAIGAGLKKRTEDVGQIWPRESGVLHAIARGGGIGAERTFSAFAALASTFPFEEPAKPSVGQFGLLVREPVGVVGAIIPWNAPLSLISNKVAPALLAGCTVVLKSSPEAPGAGYLVAEAVEAVGLPAGVLNVVTADREVSELLVRDPRVDKITFTGSTAAGRRIASICGERIARCTLELGGKSAAVILDDIDIETAARTLSQAECFLSGQVCSSLTRIVVPRSRHDELLEALAGTFSSQTQMGPLAAQRQRDRVEGYIAKGIADGGARHRRRPPAGPRQGLVRRADGVRQRGQLLGHRPGGDLRACAVGHPGRRRGRRRADRQRHHLRPQRLRVHQRRQPGPPGRGTAAVRHRGHNAMRTDFGVSFGGFKQSGIGREGVHEGLPHFLETKFVILEGQPEGYENTAL